MTIAIEPSRKRSLTTLFSVLGLPYQVFVNAAVFLNWDISKLKEGPEQAWTDEYFYTCWLVRILAYANTIVVHSFCATLTRLPTFLPATDDHDILSR